MQTHILPNQVLFSEVSKQIQQDKKVQLKTKGNSMLPFIRGGQDSVLLSKIDSPKKFDIVLAQITPQTYVMHRIIDITPEQITLMGDGNPKGTEQCTPDKIIAIIEKIIEPSEKTIDPYHPFTLSMTKLWYLLLPLRRYFLAIYRRLYPRNIQQL